MSSFWTTENVFGQAPIAPSNVGAFALNTQTIQIQWRDLSNDETAFGLRRSKNGGAWQAVNTAIPANTTFYNDSGLDANGHYCYAVFALNTNGNSELSNVACAITANPNLNSPILTDVQLIQTTTFFLTWTMSGAGGVSFNVQSRPIAGGWTPLQAGITGTSWTHTNIPELTPLCYRIEHIKNGNAYYSNEICGTTGAFPPQNITNLTFTPTTGSEHQSLSSTWTATTQSFVSYEIQTREPNGTWSNSIEQNTSQFALNNLTSVKAYEIRVRAKRTIGTTILYSAWSSPVRANTWLGIWSGDTNGDGRVNLADITFLTQSTFYGTSTPFRNNPQSSLAWNIFVVNPENYTPDLLRADANRDGKVDIFDIFPIVANYNRVASENTPALQARINSPQHAEVLKNILANLPQETQNGQSASNESTHLRKDLEMLLQRYTDELPKEATLHQNFPNPFTNETNVLFDVATPQHITLALYNVLGQQVKMILDENLTSGRYQHMIHADELSNGTYFLEMRTETQRFTKMLTIRK